MCEPDRKILDCEQEIRVEIGFDFWLSLFVDHIFYEWEKKGTHMYLVAKGMIVAEANSCQPKLQMAFYFLLLIAGKWLPPQWIYSPVSTA